MKSAGAALGNTLIPGFGAFFGGALGSVGGGIVDQSLGLGAKVTGPRLENLSVQDSRYGAGIPIVYGRARLAGNVIWSSDLIESTHTNSLAGGKGGSLSASTTTYTYSVHCAVGIAAGPVGGIATIWADSQIIYQNGSWTSGLIDGASFYLGNTRQSPDPFMQSILGGGNVPAYQGLAYIVLENLQLANFGNRLPNLTFEIVPGQATSNPSWLGSVDSSLSLREYTLLSGGMTPIPLAGNGGAVTSLLVGGYITSGVSPSLSSVFSVAAYDVTGNTPVQTARTSSASFATSAIVDSSWSLAPDGRFVAMYMQSGTSPSHQFVLYDTQSGQFGAPLAANLSVATVTKAIGWLDAQHFVIDDISGTTRGVRVFARAGLNVIDLGFWPVWGAGSASARLPLFYAQYTPSAGGLLTYMTNNATPTFTALYACQLNWSNNALVAGTPYTVAGGLTPTAYGGAHANLLATGNGEYTLCFATQISIQLMSFTPTPASAALTRPWQTFSPSIASSNGHVPLFFGDRLVFLEGSTVDNPYVLSEVLLNSGSFTLSVDSVTVANSPGHTKGFGGAVLDEARFLLLATGGAGWDVWQCAIVQRCANGSGLDAIVGDILSRSGYAGSDYNLAALTGTTVTGYLLSEPMSARHAIEPLQVYQPFDLIESNGQLTAILRHSTADAVMPSNEWRAAAEGKAPPPALTITRAQELDLPREIDVDFIDVNRNFEVNSQRARRLATHSSATQKINLPMVTTASAAKAVAETRLYALWAERELVRIYVSRAWLALDPGDVVDLGNGNLLRLTGITQNGGLLQLDGFYVNTAAYASNAVADTGKGIARSTLTTAIPTQLYLLDLPMLQGSDDQPGVYMAATGLGAWTGGSLWRAADGVNYSAIATLSAPATGGIATTALGSGSSLYMDNANTVSVQLINGTLSSCSAADLLNGANAALLGNEIIQFQTATLAGPGLYILGNLLRGRRGTEYAATSHSIGENFILLNVTTVQFLPCLLNDRGATYEFRALTKGQSLGQAVDTPFTYGLATLQPLSPVNIQAMRASGTGSDCTITWKRRARRNAEWVSYIDVPLDEASESYDLDVMNGSTVVRTFSAVSSPTVTYTAAQQTADWGTVPASFTVNVYQNSSRYGRGRAGNAIL